MCIINGNKKNYNRSCGLGDIDLFQVGIIYHTYTVAESCIIIGFIFKHFFIIYMLSYSFCQIKTNKNIKV